MFPSTFSFVLTQASIAVLAVIAILHYLLVLTLLEALLVTRKSLSQVHESLSEQIKTSENALLLARKESQPRILRCTDIYENSANQGGLWFILTASTIYSRNAFVAFHHLSPLAGVDNQFLEKQIGYGVVDNIQQDGIVVVKVVKQFVEFEDSWSALRRDEQSAKAAVLVRPCLYVKDVQELRKDGW